MGDLSYGFRLHFHSRVVVQSRLSAMGVRHTAFGKSSSGRLSIDLHTSKGPRDKSLDLVVDRGVRGDEVVPDVLLLEEHVRLRENVPPSFLVVVDVDVVDLGSVPVRCRVSACFRVAGPVVLVVVQGDAVREAVGVALRGDHPDSGHEGGCELVSEDTESSSVRCLSSSVP